MSKIYNSFILPNCIFEERLTPNEFIIYSYLLRCKDNSNRCFPSRSTIAKNCCLSVCTVDRYLQKLIDRGLVEKTQRYGDNQQYSNLYTVHIVEPTRSFRFTQ